VGLADSFPGEEGSLKQYYIECTLGARIILAKDFEDAFTTTKRLIGRRERIFKIQEPTEENFAYIRGMGGKIPRPRPQR